MWSARELDEEWLACLTGSADEEWSKWASGPGLPERAQWGSGPDWPDEPGLFGVGRAFAEGGPLDRLAPGPALAGFVQNASADGLTTLSDDCLVGVLRAWRRLASWAAAGEFAAVAELDRRRRAEVAAGADPHLAEHVGDELAAALTLTTRGADVLLDVACGLARLPLTRAALGTGEIDRVKALVITENVSGLGDAHAAAVESAIIGRAPEQTTGQLRAAIQRAVLAVDPTAAKRRQEEARKDARVEVWDERCGTAALAGRDLPPAGVLAADKRIDAMARQLKSAGRQESLNELRAQVYLALLLGQRVEGCTSAGPPPPGITQAASWNGQARGTSSPLAGGPGTVSGQSVPAGPGLTGSVNLTMPLDTWLGGSSEPGEAAGFGPLPADDARALAGLIARQPGARWCLTLTGRDGRAVAHGCATVGSPAVRKEGRPRGEPAPGPGGEVGREGRPRGEPAPGRGGGVGREGRPRGEPAPGRGGGVSREGRPRGEPAPGRGGEVGREGRPRGEPRSDRVGLAKLEAGTARAGPPESWALTVTIRALAVGECLHARESRGYQPAPGLRHLVNVRQRTCGFPGCRNPAARCDQDHTIPHDQGGRTCECNLACLCRRHHQAKQAQGWWLDQPRPGVLVWRLPHGRSYRVDPGRYPE
jgi:hypothetical protein